MEIGVNCPEMDRMDEQAGPSEPAIRAARAWLESRPLSMHKDWLMDLADVIDRETKVRELQRFHDKVGCPGAPECAVCR